MVCILREVRSLAQQPTKHHVTCLIYTSSFFLTIVFFINVLEAELVIMIHDGFVILVIVFKAADVPEDLILTKAAF